MVINSKQLLSLLSVLMLMAPPLYAVPGDRDNDGVPDATDPWPDERRYSQDSDGDSLPDSWENYQFGNLTTASNLTDTDGDGFSDLVEFTRGTDPKRIESTLSQAQRRLPPMIEALTMPEDMLAERTYSLEWKIVGYDTSYITYLVMFDCTGVEPGTCGENYNSPGRFYSVSVNPGLKENAAWQYNGAVANYFTYSHDFTVPATRADTTAWPASGSNIVVRFYQKSIKPSDANKNSISLLVPGGLTNIYYDTTGRRIQKRICPAAGCN